MTRKLGGPRFATGGLSTAILDSAHALVITLDVEGRIAGFNRACELLTGYSASEVIGARIWDKLLPDEAIEPIQRFFAGLPEGGEIPDEHENAWVTRDGRRPIIAWNNNALRNAKGEIELVVGIGVDITGRKAAGERLAHAQRMARIGSWEWTIKTDEEEWSDQFFINLGLEPGSVKPSVEEFYKYVHPGDRDAVKRDVLRAMETKQPYSADYRVIWPDGTERLVHEEVGAILDGGGKTIALAGTMQDVTELRETENHLNRLARSLANAQRISHIGNWDWDAVTKAEWWSDEVYRIMGLEPGAVTSGYDAFMERIHPDDRKKVGEAIKAAENSLGSYDMDFRIVRKDGAVRVVREAGECVLDADGRFTGLTGTVQDITGQHNDKRALSETAQRLEAAMRLARLGDWEWDPDTNLLKNSEETLRICGLGPEHAEVDNEFLMAMIPPEEHARVLDIMNRAIFNGEAYTNEYHIVRPNGDRRTVLEHGETFHDETTGRIRLVGTIQDITERKRVERALRENEARLRGIFDYAPVGIGLADPEGSLIEVNQQFADFLGYSTEETLGLSYRDYTHPDHMEVSKQQLEALLAGDVARVTQEKLYIRRDGAAVWVNRTLSLIRDEAGAPRFIVVIVEDINDRRQTEKELAKTTKRLEEAQRIANIGHWEWLPGSTDTIWSVEMHRIFGLEPGAVQPTHDSFFAMVHEDNREAIATMMADTLNTGQPYTTEFRIIRADGAKRHVFERGERYVDEQTGEWSVRGITQDITEWKAVEEKLRETAENLEKSERIAKLGSWVWEIEEDKEWWSDEIYRFLGMEVGSAVVGGYTYLEIVHPDDREHVSAALDRSLKEHVPYVAEYRIQHVDGHEIIVSEQAEIEYDRAGKPLRMRGIAQDITERKRIEQQLARLNAELEQRVEERTAELRAAQGELVKSERLSTLGQLTATVSHELRNPLGAMRTSMYVVEKKTDADDQRLRAAIERVNRNITRCDQIIDELLDYTRIRDLNIQQTNIDNWLGAVLSEQTIPDGVEVTRKFRAGGARIPADSDRLRRAVINIFENACQAVTHARQNETLPQAPEVTIETRLKHDRLEILITDNGPGVPADIREKIFEPLFSTKNFGVGLGLPTVKQIMEQHGGGVEVGERRGGGVNFALWLPLVGELQSTNL